MLEISLQKNGKILSAMNLDDESKLSEYHDNQILRCKLSGVRKPRSHKQLKLYWACCNTVADNCKENDKKWSTPACVDFQVKVATHFVDPGFTAVRPDGEVQFKYRSIAIRNLAHMDACNFFDRAFDVMAAKIGVTVEELTQNVKG